MILKGKTFESLKPPLTKRPSELGYWKLNEMPGSSVCLRQKTSIFEFLRESNMRKLWRTSKVKMGEESIKSTKSHTQKGLLLMVDSRELWTLKPKIWTSQIWTLINNLNNAIVLVCGKCSKLITVEENIISVQQLPLMPSITFCILLRGS